MRVFIKERRRKYSTPARYQDDDFLFMVVICEAVERKRKAKGRTSCMQPAAGRTHPRFNSRGKRKTFPVKKFKVNRKDFFRIQLPAVNGSNNACPLGNKRAKPYVFNKNV